jgi:hypothetical protein
MLLRPPHTQHIRAHLTHHPAAALTVKRQPIRAQRCRNAQRQKHPQQKPNDYAHRILPD